MNDWTRLRIQRAREMLARLDAGKMAHEEADEAMGARCAYNAGALQATLTGLIQAIEDEPAAPVWTRCEDAMPPMIPETVNDWRQESEYVLVRTHRGEIMLARWTHVNGDEWTDAYGQWIQQGRDGYEIDHVTEWKEVTP